MTTDPNLRLIVAVAWKVTRMTVLILVVFFQPQSLRAGESSTTEGIFNYALVGIAQFDGVSYASLIDRQTQKHFLLSNGETVGDLTLVSVLPDSDPRGPAAIVQRHGDSLLVKLEAGVSLDAVSMASPVSSDPTTAPVASSLTNGALSAPKPPPGGTLPLVFQQVDEKSLHLTPEQTQILNKLRYDFTQAVQSGGSTANAAGVSSTPATSATAAGSDSTASSPTISPSNNSSLAATNQNGANNRELSNWESAQEQSDDYFKMEFGTEAFNAYQMAHPSVF